MHTNRIDQYNVGVHAKTSLKYVFQFLLFDNSKKTNVVLFLSMADCAHALFFLRISVIVYFQGQYIYVSSQAAVRIDIFIELSSVDRLQTKAKELQSAH